MPIGPDEPHTSRPTEGKKQSRSVCMYVRVGEFIAPCEVDDRVLACYLPNDKGPRG
jgi:hypothetical protein